MNKAIELERSKPVRRRLMKKKRLGRRRFRARKVVRQITEAAALVQLIEASYVR